MSTVVFPFNQTGMVNVGSVDSGSAWGGGGTGGNRVSQASYQQWDFLVNGATAVGSGGYYMPSQSSMTFILMDTSGTVLATTTGASTSPTMTATSSFQNTSVNLFPGYTMVSSTTYWVRIVSTMGGGGLLQTNNLVQLTGPATPTISTSAPGNFGPVYGFNTNFSALSTNIAASTGYENGMQAYATGGITGVKAYSGTAVCEGGMIRFRAKIDTLYLYLYANIPNAHLRQLPADGSSGIGTFIGTQAGPSSLGNNAWSTVFTGLDNTTEYLYELSFSNGGGTILFGMMTHGGTGINTGVTAASLTRSLLLSAIGDSRVADVNGTGVSPGNAYVGSKALLSQAANKQILNVGVPGQNLQAMAARVTDITGWGLPSFVMIDAGINDIKVGSPPTPSQLNGYMAALINAIRATGGGWATVPIYYQLIKPADTSWVSGGYTYFDTYNNVLAGLAAAYAANTAPGQVGGADANVHMIDTRTWTLAGPGWESGTAFDATLYDDGIHLGSTLSSTSKNGMQTEFTKLQTIFAGPASSYTVTGPSTGVVSVASTNFTITPNGTTTNTVTPSDGGAGGTFTPSGAITLNGITPVTFTYTPATTGAKTLSFTNNSGGSIANPGNLTYTATAPAATGVTLSGPSTGIVGAASTNFTVALFPGGSTSANNTVTPHTDLLGTFSPPSVVLNTGSPSATFQFTPTAINAHTITITNTGSLANGSPLTYTVSAGGTALTLTITKPSGNPVLTWTADSLATSYNVLRATSLGGPYTVIANPSSGTLTYTDTSEPVGTIQYAVTSNH